MIDWRARPGAAGKRAAQQDTGDGRDPGKAGKSGKGKMKQVWFWPLYGDCWVTSDKAQLDGFRVFYRIDVTYCF